MNPQQLALRATGANTTRPTFEYQRKIVVQLLKDWADRYGTQATETGWPLNHHSTADKNNDVTRSQDILDVALYAMGRVSPYYPALQAVFLHEAAGHSDLDFLYENAKTYPEGDSAVLATLVDNAIDYLTESVMHLDLYCVFPDRTVKTNRRSSAEDRYLVLAAEFDTVMDEYEDMNPGGRHRGKAFDLVAVLMDVSPNTVKRAVKWRDADENHGQKHRTQKYKLNRRAHRANGKDES